MPPPSYLDPSDQASADVSWDELLPDKAVLTLDDHLEVAGIKEPALGGMFVDDGELVVTLTDTTISMATRVQPVIAQLLREIGRPETAKEVLTRAPSIRLATFGLAELSDWKRAAVSILASPNIASLDLDERRNRIVLGLVENLDTEPFIAEVTRLGIPESAILFEVTGGAEISIGGSKLGHNVRPLVGALQLEVAHGGGPCTLGGVFQWHWENGALEPFVVTASHCTPWRYGGAGEYVFQPDPHTSGNKIGEEYWDAPALTNADDPRCPLQETGDSYDCRYTDAAFIVLTGTLSSPHAQARLANDNETIGGEDMLAWEEHLLVGESVYMTGQASGQRQGHTLATCVDAKQYDDGIETGDVVLCSGVADYSSGNGDSGAPIWRAPPECTDSEIENNSGNCGAGIDIGFVGLHWGRSPFEGVLRSHFSNWMYLRTELSPPNRSGMPCFTTSTCPQ